ncbi:hypothetical protein AF72_12915 [Xylella taiwanensis]|uniref:Uncharacterized protein n=1 Tax=Xylella taiwanensis TaxID=1444770 RepID=Z9JFB4_9GAMM|nr:hypothetical protein AF72_12915 [Xylella taiwanensis]
MATLLVNLVAIAAMVMVDREYVVESNAGNNAGDVLGDS